jgi:hypothetical protein
MSKTYDTHSALHFQCIDCFRHTHNQHLGWMYVLRNKLTLALNRDEHGKRRHGNVDEGSGTRAAARRDDRSRFDVPPFDLLMVEVLLDAVKAMRLYQTVSTGRCPPFDQLFKRVKRAFDNKRADTAAQCNILFSLSMLPFDSEQLLRSKLLEHGKSKSTQLLSRYK